MIPGRDPAELSDADIRAELAQLLARGYLRSLAAEEEEPGDQNDLAASASNERTCPGAASSREDVA